MNNPTGFFTPILLAAFFPYAVFAEAVTPAATSASSAPAVVSAAGAPAGAATVSPEAEKIWQAIGMGDYVSGMVNVYGRSLKESDPRHAQLRDTQVLGAIEDAVKQEWATRFQKEFSQKELEFLGRLFSSNIYRRNQVFDKAFWSRDVVFPLIETGLKKPKTEAGKN